MKGFNAPFNRRPNPLGTSRRQNYYLPGDLENQISAFVDHYNNQRYHESIGNVTPADAYFGRHTAIIEKRKKIKKLTTQNRRLNHPCLSGYHPHPLYVVCLLGLQARAGAGALRRRSG